jgi:hypothetical protein
MQAMETLSPRHGPLWTARALIERYGLRAAAAAERHAAEARAAGEIAQADYWRSVAAAIAQLRRGRPTVH